MVYVPPAFVDRLEAGDPKENLLSKGKSMEKFWYIICLFCLASLTVYAVDQPLDTRARRVDGDAVWNYRSEKTTIAGNIYSSYGLLVDKHGDRVNGWVALNVTGWDSFTAWLGIEDKPANADMAGQAIFNLDGKRTVLIQQGGKAATKVDIPLHGAKQLIIKLQTPLVLAEPTLQQSEVENPKLTRSSINPIDGAELIIIPAGEFKMGSKEDFHAPSYEKPQHTVFLDAYYIYRNDVTVAQYRRFSQATGRAMPEAPPWGWIDTNPVVDVSWDDANAYAKWVGAELPTEAQWEKAARGTDGREYPWGNIWSSTKCSNFTEKKFQTSPVGSFPEGASPYGVLDMAGNVWQWCFDRGDDNGDYYQKSPKRNPTGPYTGYSRMLRGGSWYDSDASYFRSSSRRSSGQGSLSMTFGFRCCIPVKPSIPTQEKSPDTHVHHNNGLIINPKDDAEMIRIPEGEFLMGSSEEQIDAWIRVYPNDRRDYFTSEIPRHKVYLDTYYIYKNDVTVLQYRKFCLATGRQMAQAPVWGWQDDHPVVNVSWDDANSYAQWAGVALPTEAQWEKAARGTDGRIFPWGNEWDANKCHCSKTQFEDAKSTAPVGSFPAGVSPYGVQDMAGNVWQWCADWYSKDYYNISPARNPTGPTTGIARVTRGGLWAAYYVSLFRTASRGNCLNPSLRCDRGGFRCAQLAPTQ